MSLKLPSRDDYINAVPKIIYNNGWTEPKYKCVKCGGGMCKNLEEGITLTSNPPIYKNMYRCNDCKFVEYLEV